MFYYMNYQLALRSIDDGCSFCSQGEQLICQLSLMMAGYTMIIKRAQLAELFTKFGQKQQVICFLLTKKW